MCSRENFELVPRENDTNSVSVDVNWKNLSLLTHKLYFTYVIFKTLCLKVFHFNFKTLEKQNLFICSQGQSLYENNS